MVVSIRWCHPIGTGVCIPIITMILQNVNWGILFNHNPRNYRQGRNRESEGRRVSFLAISSEILVEQNTEQMCFYFYPMISWAYIFTGNKSCFHIALYLGVLIDNSLYRIVHLNCFSSRQSFCIQATSMAISYDQLMCSVTSQWGHVTKQIWIFQDGAKSEYLELNDLIAFGLDMIIKHQRIILYS